ncbi:hypothetical protein ACSBR1_022393 [Camellia fascicularis]
MVSVMAGFSFENMLYPSCNKLDTEKRKNYDLYRDEKGNPGFDAGNAGDQGGYTYFTSGPGQNGFNFKPNEWQNMGGGHGSSKSFSFSFGGPGGHSSFGFGLEDIFSNFFGGGGAQSESFSGLTRSESKSRSASKSIRAVNVQTYKKEITDKGMTWLLLSCTSTLKGAQSYKSVIQRTPRVFVYSYRNISQGFQNVLDLNHFEFSSGTGETLPKVLLLSTKKDTPVIWRVLSGLYHKRFVFYDAEVRDVSDPAVRKLGVDALPAVVGWLSNGEKHTLKTRISVKDIKSAVEDLSALLDGFEKRNKKAASSQAKKPHCEAGDKHIPLLLPFNFDAACGDTTPVCIIGAFRMDGSAFYLQEKHFDEIFVTRGGGLKMLDPVGRAFCCSVLANIS